MDMNIAATIDEEVKQPISNDHDAAYTPGIDEPADVPQELKLQRDLIRKLRTQIAELKQTNKELYDELLEHDADQLRRHISSKAAAEHAKEVTGISDERIGRLVEHKMQELKCTYKAKAHCMAVSRRLKFTQDELIYNALMWVMAAVLYGMLSLLWSDGIAAWAPGLFGALAAVTLCRSAIRWIKAVKTRMQLDEAVKEDA